LSEASLKTKTKSIVDQEVIEYSELVEILKILKGD
jgi:hypothetical protein